MKAILLLPSDGANPYAYYFIAFDKTWKKLKHRYLNKLYYRDTTSKMAMISFKDQYSVFKPLVAKTWDFMVRVNLTNDTFLGLSFQTTTSFWYNRVLG